MRKSRSESPCQKRGPVFAPSANPKKNARGNFQYIKEEHLQPQLQKRYPDSWPVVNGKVCAVMLVAVLAIPRYSGGIVSCWGKLLRKSRRARELSLSLCQSGGSN